VTGVSSGACADGYAPSRFVAVSGVGDIAFGIEETADGDSRVFALRGELDLETAPALRQRLHRAIEEGHTDLVVDLSGLTFLDSTGISVLVDALKHVRRLDGTLVLRSPATRTRRVLEIAGLVEIFGL
jgi:anti-sigma B factor antagonist